MVSHLARALAILMALALPGAARAQEYAFSAPTVLLECFVEPDGSVTLDYRFSFVNEPDAHVLDGVDVGMPGTRWELSNVSAWAGEAPLAVASSPYVDNGVAADLGALAIPPGGSGDVRVVARDVRGLLFSDTSNPGFASFRVTPTWFGAQFVRGESDVRVVVHLPPGVPAGELKWHAVPWVGQVEVEAGDERPLHAAVVFERRYALTGPWNVGVSFPKAAPDGTPLVAGVAEITTWDLFEAWASRPEVRGASVIAFLLAFTIGFFWATRRTGCPLWGCLTAVMLILFAANPVAPILGWPVLIAGILLLRRARQKKRKRYVPAVATVEGGGIKRGLTAPEAACLLEVPPEKILLLVLYGLSKKGFVTLEETKDRKSLLVKNVAGFGVSPEDDVRLAAAKGSVLHPYESAFLALLGASETRDVSKLAWAPPLEGLAKHAGERLSGYDLEETKKYYELIVARAWKEAETAGNVTLKKEVVDRTFDWLVLDGDAFGRMGRWDRGGFGYTSPWWPRTGGVGAPSTAGGAPTGGAGPPSLPGAPKAGDVAGSFAGRMEGLAGSFATSLGLGATPGVFSGVDRVTGQVLQSMAKSAASGKSGGGGGGFSCACACAGCACACACAGGGR